VHEADLHDGKFTRNEGHGGGAWTWSSNGLVEATPDESRAVEPRNGDSMGLYTVLEARGRRSITFPQS